MDLFQLIILGLIQGITEFLPISSSAHLILLPELTDWPDQGLANDIAAHVGSLAAVMIYFRKDLQAILSSFRPAISSEAQQQQRRLGLFILIASVPIMLAGLMLYKLVADYFRDPIVIAIASIVFGVLLLFADRTGTQQRSITTIKLKDALWIGLAQAVALIPGTSRSGITMTAALMLGLQREAAARFSFYLSIPAILMAGGYQGLRYFLQQGVVDWTAFFIVALSSAISAAVTIHYFLKFLQATGMLPYVIYRCVLGGFLLYWFA